MLHCIDNPTIDLLGKKAKALYQIISLFISFYSYHKLLLNLLSGSNPSKEKQQEQ
jgi:hypothetical protein